MKAIDSTGAGDCFSGGYIAALQRSLSHEEAARIANAAGALSVQQLGATAGILGGTRRSSGSTAKPRESRIHVKGALTSVSY